MMNYIINLLLDERIIAPKLDSAKIEQKGLGN